MLIAIFDQASELWLILLMTSFWVWINGKQSKPFNVVVGLRSRVRFVIFPFYCLHELDRQIHQANECATLGNGKISSLLLADDLVLLSSTESGFQCALNSFAVAWDTAGIKISIAKTEVFRFSWNPDQCVLQRNGAIVKQLEKFKYLGVAFTSDGRQDNELDTRRGKAGAVIRALHYSVVIKRELSKKAKFSIFKSVLVPHSQLWSWIMTERMRSQVQESKMFFFTKNRRSYTV